MAMVLFSIDGWFRSDELLVSAGSRALLLWMVATMPDFLPSFEN
jgi:hypothetical protein